MRKADPLQDRLVNEYIVWHCSLCQHGEWSGGMLGWLSISLNDALLHLLS
ncbi:hypothetical protein ABER23_06400 [Paenibacillus lautus]